MKITKQTTPVSCMWQIRLFGKDFMWGWIDIQEATDIGEDNANIVLKTRQDDEIIIERGKHKS